MIKAFKKFYYVLLDGIQRIEKNTELNNIITKQNETIIEQNKLLLQNEKQIIGILEDIGVILIEHKKLLGG